MTDRTFNSLAAWLEATGAEVLEDVDAKYSTSRNYCDKWVDGRPTGDSGIAIHWFLVYTDKERLLLNISKSVCNELTWEKVVTRRGKQSTEKLEAYDVLRQAFSDGAVIQNFLDDEGTERWCLQKSGGEDAAKRSHVGLKLSELKQSSDSYS